MSKKKEATLEYNAERVYRVKFFNGKSMLVSEANLSEASQANSGVKSMRVLEETLYKRGGTVTFSTGTTWGSNPFYVGGTLTATDASSIDTITGSALTAGAVTGSAMVNGTSDT
jgi:hypothetical protein